MQLVESMSYYYYKMAMYELQVMNKKDYFDKLSYNSVLYLNVIYQLNECTISQLADTLRITRSAVTIKVNELVKQKTLIKTQSSVDKRVFYVTLSLETKENFNVYNRVYKRIEKELIKKYSHEQLKMFNEILNTISEFSWEELDD